MVADEHIWCLILLFLYISACGSTGGVGSTGGGGSNGGSASMVAMPMMVLTGIVVALASLF